MRIYRPYLLFLIIVLGCSYAAESQEDRYQVTLIRAAPGELLNAIEFFKETANTRLNETGIKPLILRHSQGDSWDIMIVEYIASGGIENNFLPDFGGENGHLVAHHEEMIVVGPNYKSFRSETDQNGYFHIEMFISLPDKQKELYEEREMENEYLNHLGRPVNFIFTRRFGARWDLFTLGCYRDLIHYAESALIPLEKEEVAAKEAGFESVGTIGSYLRSLIYEHHDTLATKVF